MPGTRVTPDVEAAIRRALLDSAGVPFSTVAKAHGVSHGVVNRIASANGIKPRRPGRPATQGEGDEIGLSGGAWRLDRRTRVLRWEAA